MDKTIVEKTLWGRKKHLPKLLGVLASIVFLLACGDSALGNNKAQSIFKQVSGSIVIIRTYDLKGSVATDKGFQPVFRDKPKKQGSGVVIAPQKVLTNWHVVRGGKIEVEYNRKKFSAEFQYQIAHGGTRRIR